MALPSTLLAPSIRLFSLLGRRSGEWKRNWENLLFSSYTICHKISSAMTHSRRLRGQREKREESYETTASCSWNWNAKPWRKYIEREKKWIGNFFTILFFQLSTLCGCVSRENHIKEAKESGAEQIHKNIDSTCTFVGVDSMWMRVK